MTGSIVQHYRVGERLGSGGMGEVYRAEDLRLGRTVALKFLSPALESDPVSRARLLKEASAASLLRSPNIAVTYDIGEHAGTDFIVMEFVEGELLSRRVAKGALPPREVAEIGLQVSDALDEAHARGIVHRDIKSANLIRTGRGLVKVLDFGLAKFLPAAGADVTRTQMTVAGMVVGTVSYMAPEQALGHSVDHRADIFSLGVVLFELLTGRLPFHGTTTTEIIDQILHAFPPPLSRFVGGLPATFETIVSRALEKDPAARYQSAREMHDDLRQVAESLDASSQRAASGFTPLLQATEPSVAVMTFTNITRDPADEWIGTGIAETVSSDLKKIHGLTILGRARVYDALRNLAPDAHLDETLAIDIGRRLGATWVVVGGFQRMGPMVRITAHFMEVATGTVRRTVKVDGTIDAIFALQDQIVYELSQGLNVVLRGTEIAGIERQETRSVEAYRHYARGMMNLRQATRDSMERAISAFEEATAQDPEYARAWAALGGAYGLKGNFLSIPELTTRAVEIEQRALALDPNLADAHIWLGTALIGLGRMDEAIAAYREALRLEPDNGQAHQGLARSLWLGKGDFAAAIPVFDRAIALNPEAGYSYLQLALLLTWEGQLDRAEEICRRAIDLQEQFISGNMGLQIVGAHSRLGYVHYIRGNYAKAHAEYERELVFIGASDHALRERTFIELNVKIGATHLREGQREEAERYFARAQKSFDARVATGADDPSTRYYMAVLHALRGDVHAAMDALERAAAKLPALTRARARVDPDLQSLSAEPRFRALLGPAPEAPQASTSTHPSTSKHP